LNQPWYMHICSTNFLNKLGSSILPVSVQRCCCLCLRSRIRRHALCCSTPTGIGFQIAFLKVKPAKRVWLSFFLKKSTRFSSYVKHISFLESIPKQRGMKSKFCQILCTHEECQTLTYQVVYGLYCTTMLSTMVPELSHSKKGPQAYLLCIFHKIFCVPNDMLLMTFIDPL
jgi:hypothetical protein